MATISCNPGLSQSSSGADGHIVSRGHRVGLCLLFVVALLPLAVWAQSQTDIKDAEASGEFGIPKTAPVVVNGEVRFHVVGVSAYPAERRAHEIAQRIETLAQDPTFDPKNLRSEDFGDYHRIFPGQSRKAILSVLETDADSEGVARTVLVKVLRNSIAEAIEDYRHDRNSRPY